MNLTVLEAVHLFPEEVEFTIVFDECAFSYNPGNRVQAAGFGNMVIDSIHPYKENAVELKIKVTPERR